MKQCLDTVMRYAALLAIVGLILQLGRLIERLERVELIAAEYTQGVKMQGTITRSEYIELRDIHVRDGDL